MDELNETDHSVLIIDDSSNYDKSIFNRFSRSDWVRMSFDENGGKKMFWDRWDEALKHFKHFNDNEYVMFMPDDWSNLNLDYIEGLTKQGWDNSLFAVNIVNDGRTHCWGVFGTGQEDISIGDNKLKEVGFVDCGFLSNRHTMSKISIDPVPESWFDRPDKSSGVGYQLTKKMRKIKVKMMTPNKSLAFHGDHPSVMHPEERKRNPLISK